MSGRMRLELGAWLEFEDERWQVVGFTELGVRLRGERGRLQLVMVGELVADASFRRTATYEQAGTSGQVDREAVLQQLPPTEQARVTEMEEHLLEAECGFRSGSADRPGKSEPRTGFDPSSTTLTSRMAAKATELGITERRLWQLRAAWLTEGLFGLVDKRRTRPRDPLAGVDSRIIAVIRAQAAAEQLDSSASIGGRFRRRTQNRLDDEYGPGAVVLPGPDRFRRITKVLLQHLPSDTARRRIRAANQPDRTFGHLAASRPGEVVMMDTTKLDVTAYDAATETTGLIELTVALDLATRSLLAWRLTPRGTKGIDIGLLLADMLAPEPMRPHWPEALRFAALPLPTAPLLSVDERLTHAAARPVIYPQTLLFDHGKPYQSVVMARACTRLGISIQDARAYTPTDKPNIERVFETINRQFCEHVAGYTGADPMRRGLHADADACWSIEQIAEFFAEYAIAIYQRRHHQGLVLPAAPGRRMSPNEAYALAVASAGYLDCPTDPDLYYELLPIPKNTTRTIHPSGVVVEHLTYNAEILYRYRSVRSPYPDGRWPIRRDPRNLLHAYFHDPADGTWHVLRWTHATDAHQPFTDTTHREARRLLAARGHNPDDQNQIATALLNLQNRTDDPASWTRTARSRWIRDTHRGRAQKHDEQRISPARTPDPPVPDPTSIDTNTLDLDTVQAAEVWDPQHEGGPP